MTRIATAYFFTVVLVVLCSAGHARAQATLNIDDFSVDQGPFSGPQSPTSVSSPTILGGARTYINIAGGDFQVAGGLATFSNPDTDPQSFEAFFLEYDALGAGLSLDLTPYNSVVIDVNGISTQALRNREAFLSRFDVSSPGESGSLTDPDLHNGLNVLDFDDFFQSNFNEADFSNIEQITIEAVSGPAGSFAFDEIYFSTLEAASIGDRVWDDLDGDGVQDPGEPGIADATVNLLANLDGGSTPDDLAASKTTNFDGSYQFGNLAPGEYVIEVLLPDGYGFASPIDVGSDLSDSDIDPFSFRTATFSLTNGQTLTSIDAGFVVPEPTSLALLALGGLLVVRLRRSR